MALNTDLNALQIFHEVVRSGSFSKAALILKQPKSRVSRHIARLEKVLGVQLIYRTTRQFQLTQAGQDLYQKSSPLLNELNQTWDQLSQSSDEMSGAIRITVPEDIGSEFMGKLCKEFTDEYPKIHIGVWSSNLFIDLVKESIDIAIRIGRVKDSTMIQKKIGSVELIFVASPVFASRYGGLQNIDDIERVPFLAFTPADLKKAMMKVTNGKEKRTLKLKPHFASNNFLTLRQAALEDGGVTLLSMFLARDYLASGELVQVFKDWATESAPVQFLIPHQKEPPARVKKFVEFASVRLLQYLG